MTALDTLIYNLLDIATLGIELYSTTTYLDGVSDEAKSTTIAGSVTTALNNIQVPDTVVIVRDAQSYVESMTTEELVLLEQMLVNKELEISEENIKNISTEHQKIYIKETTKQQ